MEENKNLTEEIKRDVDELFEGRISSFGVFYVGLVCVCIAMSIAAVVIAVYLSVFGGLLVAMLAAVFYRAFLVGRMKHQLGLSYRRVDGGIACSVIKIETPLYRREQWELYEKRIIPSKLIFLDVVEVCESGVSGVADDFATTVRIPRSVKRIDAGAFSGMSALRTLVYDGTDAEWQEVECPASLDGIEVVCLGDKATD